MNRSKRAASLQDVIRLQSMRLASVMYSPFGKRRMNSCRSLINSRCCKPSHVYARMVRASTGMKPATGRRAQASTMET